MLFDRVMDNIAGAKSVSGRKAAWTSCGNATLGCGEL